MRIIVVVVVVEQIFISIIIYSTTITSGGTLRLHPPTGNTPAREISPLGGRGKPNTLRRFPIPAFPPYVVRTPHIHGATAYGAPNSSGGRTMVI